MQNESRYNVPNLERALIILEFLVKQAKGCGITMIAEKLDFPKNSVFRILKTLLAHGYVVEIDNQYQVSTKLLALGYVALGESTIVSKAADLMVDLRNETHETVVLGRLAGVQGLTLEVVLSDEPVKFVVDVGFHFQLHNTAPGKVLVAYLPEDEQDKILDKIDYQIFNERTIKNRAEMEAEISRVLEMGYAIDHGEKVLGVHCIAAPVYDYKRNNIAALWITGPANRMPEGDFVRLGNLVMEYARRISLKMGYDPDIHELDLDLQPVSGRI
ncbi:MAG: IclR family transcriptional regulator [Spirochaetia bacterium]